jgi:succinate dehydrogenase/fumarate reductase cytochrome b subunit
MLPVLADAALSSTIALIVIFFVIFPVLAHGLIGLAVAVGLGEREDNRRYARGEDDQPSQG